MTSLPFRKGGSEYVGTIEDNPMLMFSALSTLAITAPSLNSQLDTERI